MNLAYIRERTKLYLAQSSRQPAMWVYELITDNRELPNHLLRSLGITMLPQTRTGLDRTYIYRFVVVGDHFEAITALMDEVMLREVWGGFFEELFSEGDDIRQIGGF